MKSLRRAGSHTKLALLSGWLLCVNSSFAATVSWTGSSGDGHWGNPQNWSSGALPTSNDDVVINVPGETTVRLDVFSTVVRSLQCHEAFVVQNGSLTLTAGSSVINGSLEFLPDRGIHVYGTTTTLTVHGAATNIASLEAGNGASISLPNARELVAVGTFAAPLLYAYDNGRISVSNLTNIVIAPGLFWQLYADSGGRIDLPKLRVPEGPLRVEVLDAGSQIDLSGMIGLWTTRADHWEGGSLSAGEGGSISIPNVTSLDRVDCYLEHNAQVAIAQWRSFTDAWLEIVGRTNTFAAMTNFTGTLNCNSATVEFPKLTQLVATNHPITFLADNAVISLFQVTNGLIAFDLTLAFNAFSGGRIELPHLATVTAGNVEFLTDGPAAVIDLSSLNGLFSDNNGGSLIARNGGVILLSENPMLLAGVRLDIQGTPGGAFPPFLAPSQSLVVYGRPWQSYRVEWRDPTKPSESWSLYERVPLIQPFEIVSDRAPKNLALRVQAFIADPPEVDLREPSEGTTQLILFGVPGQSYQIQTKTTLLTTATWANGPSTTMTNSFFIYSEAAATNAMRFYRAREL